LILLAASLTKKPSPTYFHSSRDTARFPTRARPSASSTSEYPTLHHFPTTLIIPMESPQPSAFGLNSWMERVQASGPKRTRMLRRLTTSTRRLRHALALTASPILRRLLRPSGLRRIQRQAQQHRLDPPRHLVRHRVPL
jgi:hypothetical protein